MLMYHQKEQQRKNLIQMNQQQFQRKIVQMNYMLFLMKINPEV